MISQDYLSFEKYGRGIRKIRDLDLVLLGIAISLIWLFALDSAGVPGWYRLDSVLLNATLYFSSWFLPFGLVVLASLAMDRPASPFAHIRETLLDSDHRQKIAAGLPLLLMLSVMMPVFSGIKSAIPLFNEYSWDATLIEADRAIHGTDAWRVLQPVLGYPLITSIVSVFYHLWLLLIYIGGVWFAIYCPDAVIRRRYFFSYLLLWSVGGSAMAIAFASVGPCFAQPLIGIDTFVPQMDYLRAANEQYPVMVLKVQEELLRWHASGDFGLGRGITALPSMHVGLAFLFWLGIRQIDRRLGAAFFGFFVVILLGSVHLAYHYAVDGYASIALVMALWWLSGRWVKLAPVKTKAVAEST